MKFVENLFYGTIITTWHITLFFITSFFILGYDDLTVMGILLFFMIVTYIFNWKYNDCFMTIWESDYTNLYAANVIGLLFIPCFGGTKEDTSVAGSTIVIAMLLFVSFKFFIPLIESLADTIKENKEIDDRQQNRERRRMGYT